MLEPAAVTTLLFADIEGSSSLWDREPDRMRAALARHDALARTVVEAHRGTIVKTTGDGFYAAFVDPPTAIAAALALQLVLADATTTGGIALRVRSAIHAGVCEYRDGDYYGATVNRAARIMDAAHGGQVLLSRAVAVLAEDRLPAGATLRDLGRVRLRGLDGPEHVFQLQHPDLRNDFPALRALEATPGNLPRQITAFVGREQEVRALAERLKNVRLLTLTGMGGLGKTRLALRLGAEAMREYPDGVWLVELASLRDESLVAQSVAAALGVKEDGGRPATEAVAAHLRDRQLLLILDNCEHLLGGCASLVTALLQTSPTVAIVATSRERLHVRGEICHAVKALTTPDCTATSEVSALMACEAVNLFVERAVAVQPAFRLTEGNALAIAEICCKLEGIPLGLELAAARLRTLSVDALSERLADRFHLLTGGDRHGIAHHRTLRELIDWSYDLLASDERLLLRRLTVFSGGWTLEAVEAVCSGGGLEKECVLDVMAGLVDKSLVTFTPHEERYRVLETVREYAQEKLGEQEHAALRTRHLAFYVDFAERARPRLSGPEQREWLSRLDLELENLLGAHAWCDRAERGSEFGLRLAFAIKPYWFNRGRLTLGHRLTDEALRRETARGIARCRGLSDAGQISYFMGRYDEACGYLVESLEIARELGDTRMIAALLQPLGMARLGQDDIAGAREHLVEGLALAEQLGNRREIAAATNALAQLHRHAGDGDAAAFLFEQALALARALDDREMIAVALLNLAMVAVERGKDEPARSQLIEVHRIATAIGSRAAGQSMLDVCAGLAAVRGECHWAARFYGAGEAQTVETGLHRDPADEAFVARLVAAARADCDPVSFSAAEAEGRALRYPQAIDAAYRWLSGDAADQLLTMVGSERR